MDIPPAAPADGGDCVVRMVQPFTLHSWQRRWPHLRGGGGERKRKNSSSDMASFTVPTATDRGEGTPIGVQHHLPSTTSGEAAFTFRVSLKRRALPTTPDATIRRSTHGGLPTCWGHSQQVPLPRPLAQQLNPHRLAAYLPQEESSYQPPMTRPRCAPPTYGEDEWTDSVFVAHRRWVEGSPPHEAHQLPRRGGR